MNSHDDTATDDDQQDAHQAKAGDVEDTPDGGAIVQLENEEQSAEAKRHFANIVEDVDRSELLSAVSDLLEKIERDKESRSKRDKLYEEGLRRTGLGDDAPGGASFSGANRVVHPMLIEACVDFSARVMREIFPPSGPVKSKILGPQEKEKVEKAERKASYMNWQTTQQMPELRGELEQLTTQVPLGGAQYLKIFWNKNRNRPVSEFVPIDDVLLPFAATNFYSAERKTHVQYITAMEYRRRVKDGMYVDVDLATPEDPEETKAGAANNNIEGRQASSYNEDGLRTILEVYAHIEFDGEVSPYILTIDKSTEQALSLYRNWDEDDATQEELDWIVEFPFIPWRGAYPIGLTHMIGGLAGSATGALRALLDSAHIQNMPSLLKLKGGPSGQTLNLQPTEVTEIEGGALVDDIRKIAMAIPFNAPSPTLFQLLGFLVDAGKGVVQTSFEKLNDQNPNQPVGTTMALIEQGMIVFSSIHSRLHASMARLFGILHRLNSAYLTVEDISAQETGIEVKPEDFDDPLDVVPVSDPQIFSETQRFAQVQAVIQRSQAVPQLYDVRKVEEMFLKAMKIPSDILAPKPGEDDLDPASENVAASMGRPIYVLPKQEHLAHLQVHMAFLKSPLFGQNPAIIKSFLYPMAIHLRDHLLHYYLAEAHHGARLAVENGKIKSEADEEAKIITQVQALIEQQFGTFAQELAQIDQAAQQYKPAPPPMPQDHSLQIAGMNAQLQEKLAGQRAQIDAQRLQLEQQKLQQAPALKQLDIQAKTAQAEKELQLKQAALQQDASVTQFQEQQENARTQADNDSRERMNAADNDTAMRIVASEIATGERSNISTGTGINP